jgi:hypothetical protein
VKKEKHTKKILLFLSILLVVTLVGSFVGFKIYTSNYYAADQATIEDIRDHVGDKVISFTDLRGTVFMPSDLDVKAVIIFYPGGKVEFSAYGGLMYELADKGYLCVIPKMPENLAVLGIDVIDDLRKTYADEMVIVGDVDWYLAGHSLGGAAAAKYLAGKAEKNGSTGGDSQVSGAGDDENGSISAEEIAAAGNTANGGFKGLILCASYPADDLSDTGLRLLSIYGSNDGVINAEKYNECKANWPQDSTEQIIEGGIHSYFGCYGIQDGDGVPEISNQTQLNTTAKLIDDWISK